MVITREMVREALAGMKKFHEAQVKLHRDFGMSFVRNVGRRNVIMSTAQEALFAKSISKIHPTFTADGRTGKADIYDTDSGREIECKVTSPHPGVNFKTDYSTLTRKGTLDYLYVIASDDFKSFCVIFFEGLTTMDFRNPASGSRGYADMVKASGMKKGTVLWGTAQTQVDKAREAMHKEIAWAGSKLKEDIRAAEKALVKLSSSLGSAKSSKERQSIKQKIKRLNGRPERLRKAYDKKVQSLRNALSTTVTVTPRYSFVLEPLPSRADG